MRLPNLLSMFLALALVLWTLLGVPLGVLFGRVARLGEKARTGFALAPAQPFESA